MWWKRSHQAEPRRGARRAAADSAAHSRLARPVIAGLAVLSVAALALLAWMAAEQGTRALLWRNDLFRIRAVRIECTGDVITPKHIMEYAGLSDVTHLFDADIRGIREQLLANVPRLKSVEIRRRLPGDLIVRVRERVAVAQLELPHYCLTLDRDGVVLGPASGRGALPLLSGYAEPGIRPGVRLRAGPVRRALEVLDVCQTTPVGQGVRIVSLDVRDPEALDLRLADGERVRLAWAHMSEASALSRQQLEQKLARLVDSLASAARRHKRIESIDMSLDNNFPAREY